jgi:ABC-type multidrug transport system permease subunit
MQFSERRVARLMSIAVSAAVAVADVILFFAFLHYLPGRIPGSWVWMIGAGIVVIFLFAARRTVIHYRLYREER